MSVKNFTDKELLGRMRSLNSFIGIPDNYHIIAVRSQDNDPERYDDKLYLFKGTKFIMVMPCTTNSGIYGQKNFHKWSRKGVAVVKSNEIYYNAFKKSNGRSVRHHNGKMMCLRQIRPMKYFRDFNRNGIIEEIGTIYYRNYSTNIHTNSYKHKTGIWSWLIGRWSVGCIVINDLTKYYDMLKLINDEVTLTLLKE